METRPTIHEMETKVMSGLNSPREESPLPPHEYSLFPPSNMCLYHIRGIDHEGAGGGGGLPLRVQGYQRVQGAGGRLQSFGS